MEIILVGECWLASTEAVRNVGAGVLGVGWFVVDAAVDGG